MKKQFGESMDVSLCCSNHPHYYVEFYQSFSFLQSSVIEYLKLGIEKNEAVIVFAKESLNKAIMKQLQEDIPGFSLLLSTKQIQLLDATQMLNFILENGKIDESNFDVLVGGTIRLANKKFSKVRVYGELVQVLAEKEMIKEGLEIENLWNQFLHESPNVTLLRGYNSKTPGIKERINEILSDHVETSINENTMDMVKADLIAKVGRLETQMLLKGDEKKEPNALHIGDELQDQLVQSLKLHHLGELTAGISHEIVNPVTIINGNLLVLNSLMDQRDFSNPLFAKNIESIKQASARIDLIVRNVLKAARKNHHLAELCNVSEAIECVLEILKPHLKEQQTQVEFTPTTEHKVSIGQSELIQIFLNIMLNATDAIKSSRSNGSGKIKIMLHTTNDNKVEIRIQDNGGGVKPEDQTRIFQPFFTTKKEGEGTGLGLSIARHIVEKNEGSIQLETSSSGATFCLSLPLSLPS